MKINSKVLTPFIGYMKSKKFSIKENKGNLILNKGRKLAVIYYQDEDFIEVDKYCYQNYMSFLHQWLNDGNLFINKMWKFGAMIIHRLRGKNYIECLK